MNSLRVRTRVAALVTGACFTAGCATSVKGRPLPASDASVEFVCTAQVEALGKQYVGEASSSASTDDVKRDAKERACAAMRLAEGVDCSDKKQFDQTLLTMTQVVDGSATYQARALVRPVKGIVEGAGRATGTAVNACKVAVSAGSAKAPAETDCRAVGLACEEIGTRSVRCSPVRADVRARPRCSRRASPAA